MTEEVNKVGQGGDKLGAGAEKKEDNTIFIGSKPLVNYIRAVITQFTKWDAPEVTIKSRGKFISKAVDVAEVSKRSLAEKMIGIKDVRIASESFESEGKSTNISTMDIVLGK
jgi:DNA-binding protein